MNKQTDTADTRTHVSLGRWYSYAIRNTFLCIHSEIQTKYYLVYAPAKPFNNNMIGFIILFVDDMNII